VSGLQTVAANPIQSHMSINNAAAEAFVFLFSLPNFTLSTNKETNANNSVKMPFNMYRCRLSYI